MRGGGPLLKVSRAALSYCGDDVGYLGRMKVKTSWCFGVVRVTGLVAGDDGGTGAAVRVDAEARESDLDFSDEGASGYKAVGRSRSIYCTCFSRTLGS